MQLAINYYASWEALNAQLQFYGADKIGSQVWNSGFATGHDLPIYRLHHLWKLAAPEANPLQALQPAYDRLAAEMPVGVQHKTANDDETHQCSTCQQLIDLWYYRRRGAVLCHRCVAENDSEVSGAVVEHIKANSAWLSDYSIKYRTQQSGHAP